MKNTLLLLVLTLMLLSVAQIMPVSAQGPNPEDEPPYNLYCVYDEGGDFSFWKPIDSPAEVGECRPSGGYIRGRVYNPAGGK